MNAVLAHAWRQPAGSWLCFSLSLSIAWMFFHSISLLLDFFRSRSLSLSLFLVCSLSLSLNLSLSLSLFFCFSLSIYITFLCSPSYFLALIFTAFHSPYVLDGRKTFHLLKTICRKYEGLRFCVNSEIWGGCHWRSTDIVGNLRTSLDDANFPGNLWPRKIDRFPWILQRSHGMTQKL